MAVGAAVMAVAAVVMMAVAAVVMAVVSVVAAVSRVVLTVAGSEKNKYFSFLSHSNGPSRVRDSYKASIASYES